MNVGLTAYKISAQMPVNADFYGFDVKTMDSLDMMFREDAVKIPKGKGVEELHEKLSHQLQLAKK